MFTQKLYQIFLIFVIWRVFILRYLDAKNNVYRFPNSYFSNEFSFMKFYSNEWTDTFTRLTYFIV